MGTVRSRISTAPGSAISRARTSRGTNASASSRSAAARYSCRDRLAVPLHRRVPRLAPRERVREHAARVVLEARRKVVHRLALARQLEPEVVHPPLQRARTVLLLG